MNSSTPAAPSAEAAPSWSNCRGLAGAGQRRGVRQLLRAGSTRTSAYPTPTADPGWPWAFRERFARPLFALIPDLDGQVERRFAIAADCAYIELTLRTAPGGHPISCRVCDQGRLCARGW